MTARLYYTDSYLTDFTASVIDLSDDGLRVSLDRSAFYPNCGGQPSDRGEINGAAVVDVIDDDDQVVHVLDRPLEATEVQGHVDWTRRFDHMQQHSGQHLLSAVFNEFFGLPTLSFHLGETVSTIELGASSIDPATLEAVALRANGFVFENRPIGVTFQHASEVGDLRKPSEREGELRIVTIDGLDRSACGGTHVRSTGEIGPILIRKTEKIRSNTRVEFLCGFRAVRRAQADYEALAKISRIFSSGIDDLPALVSAQAERLQDAEKVRRKLSAELAGAQGRELYDGTSPDGTGVRRLVRRIPKGAINDDLRALAQGFTARPAALFIALIEDPPSVLVAVSKENPPLHAGDTLKRLLAEAGGRGGGNAQLAQGSLPSTEALEKMGSEVVGS
jgi:alanyl-tRNA synthetase